MSDIKIARPIMAMAHALALTSALALSILSLGLSGKAMAEDAPIPLPQEPSVFQTKRLEDGKVIVNIGTRRDAAYRIGASIPIVIVFELQHSKPVDAGSSGASPDSTSEAPYDPATALTNVADAPMAPAAKPLPVPRINVEGLSMGVLSADAQDTAILAPPVVQAYSKGDKDYLRVVFWGWQFVTAQKGPDGKYKRQVSLTADFLYAVDALPDGQADWKKATTPEMLIDIVPTAGEEQITPREGDLTAKESNHAAIIPYLEGAGILLMLPVFALAGWLAYAQYMKPRRLTEGQIFWREIDPVIAQAEELGEFSLNDYQKILYELRQYYDVATLHGADLLKALEAAPHYPSIERVFALEGAFFMKDGVVTKEQHEDLMASLKLLVPRI